MNPFRKKNAHEELTDPKNRRVNATLNQRAIRRVTLYEAREENLKDTLAYAVKWKERHMKGQDVEKLPNIQRPTRDVAATFLELSSTDGGEHRKDLVEALKAGQAQGAGFGIQVAAAPQQPMKKTNTNTDEARGGGLSG